MDIPAQLIDRLTADELEQLRALLGAVAEFMPRVYRDAIFDYQESRGDDSQYLGLRIYKHLRHEATGFATAAQGVGMFEPNGSYELAIGPLRIRIDLLGHFAYEDVMVCFPDNSPTKDAVGDDNRAQMRLELPCVDLKPSPADYDLNRLTIGHFGNPREGLGKWYLGAWTRTDAGAQRWAWIVRQDESGEGALSVPLPPREPIVPYDRRTADTVSVRPRRSA
jgi:hypothetical protein